MYGLIGKLYVRKGHRKKLKKTLSKAFTKSRGCLSYDIKRDPDNKRILWVSEVWSSAASHRRSLKSDRVRKAIKKGRKWVKGGYGAHFPT